LAESIATSTSGTGGQASAMFVHVLSQKVAGIDHSISQENIKTVDGVAEK